MRILDIALKDLTQLFRDKRSALFLLIMPIIFTLLMALTYNDAAQPVDPRLALGWANQDGNGLVSDQLFQSLSNAGSLRLVDLGMDTPETVAQQVASGELAAALFVPAGYSQQVLAGEQPQLLLVADPVNSAGLTVLQVVRVEVSRLMSAAQIAVLHTNALPAGKVDPAAESSAAFQAAMALWQQVTENGPQIKMVMAQGAASTGFNLGGNPYNQTSPGILVMFAIFGLINSANLLVLERKSRTLERMVTTSLNRAGIIAGHLLAMFAVTFLQEIILVLFGQLALNVEYFREPLAVLLVMIAVALWVACMGLMIGALARSEERVILIAMVFMFVISAVGGAWFPLETAGAGFAAVGKLTPGAWAMTGFQNILIRGLDIASVLLPVAALLAYAAAFFGLAVWKFKN